MKGEVKRRPFRCLSNCMGSAILISWKPLQGKWILLSGVKDRFSKSMAMDSGGLPDHCIRSSVNRSTERSRAVELMYPSSSFLFFSRKIEASVGVKMIFEYLCSKAASALGRRIIFLATPFVFRRELVDV